MACPNYLRPFTSVLALTLLAAGLFPVSAHAENDGQADLDKATQQKLGAQTAADLDEVIQLCESALKKGLDKSNTEFANNLLASAFVQRGGISAAKVYRDVLGGKGAIPAPDGDWKTSRDEALADLEKGVKLNPKQAEAEFEIAKLSLLPGGDRQKALEALDKTIALADENPKLRADAFLRRALVRSGNKQRLADLDEAVRVLPGNAVLLRTRGVVHAEGEDWNAALADFDKSIAANPKDVLTYEMKAEVLLKIKKPPEALAALEKGHQAIPGNIDLLVAKGRILVALSNYKAAAEELTRAVAIDGSNLPILELRAALYEQLGEKAKALADVNKVLKVKPGDLNLVRMRAILLSDLGKYEAAAEELLTLHKANPKDSLTMLQLGTLYTGMKKYEKAVETFTAIMADRPDDMDAIRGRADALLNLGRRAGAIADYERALKLQPHDVGLLNNFAWVLATAPEDNLRNGHRALALATDACRQTDYKQDYILSTLAAAYAETGDFESARRWAAAAVDAKPSERAPVSRKDELKKELQSYQANKPWREALPEPESKVPEGTKPSEKRPDEKGAGGKSSADMKKGEAAPKKDPGKSDTPQKKRAKDSKAAQKDDAMP